MYILRVQIKLPITCGHTQYGGCSVIQRLWLVSAFLHHDKEAASKPRTAHTAVRYAQLQRKKNTHCSN